MFTIKMSIKCQMSISQTIYNITLIIHKFYFSDKDKLVVTLHSLKKVVTN